MLATERKIADHYTHGGLADAIAAGLEAMKQGSDASPVELLAGVDEFHMGGRPATRALVERLELEKRHAVLDIGCGLGGTARFLNATYGCKVAGCDLTPEYVEVGNHLNHELELSDQIELSVASALATPYGDGRFDRATMLHVGMNIADKAALMAETARVTKPGAMFGVYDVMRQNARPIAYPVAWAADDATSFLASPDEYCSAMQDAGFEILETEDKREVALKFFETIKARLAKGAPPPLGLHIVMGEDAKTKVGNMHANIESGAISPVQILARRI